MELITIDEKALYGTPLSEAVKEELGQNLTLAPNILSEDALLNKSVKEIEKMALEEAEKTSPKHQRGKEVKRKGYARCKFLKGFRIVMVGREVKYKLEWISVKQPVLYGDKGMVKTKVEETLLKEERKVFTALMLVYSVKGGKLNAKLWMPQIEASGEFKYIIVDGKYVKLKGGKGSHSLGDWRDRGRQEGRSGHNLKRRGGRHGLLEALG
ncbi:hypothetical protein J5U23_01433 [Saccharolobus shibatae B12]|uniref:Transposase n=1 Tax=Saccharolobus shibatae (strain ATCC 51178 / DSM 5389 / JCM 8931 / NBRC 15437 / B12) TaxID=523848 RepID=A0A8F5BNF8_SACSH|nr:hypothetical protein J5U23_01433 [Saccharolobus shibatae B12]